MNVSEARKAILKAGMIPTVELLEAVADFKDESGALRFLRREKRVTNYITGAQAARDMKVLSPDAW
jgi:hypothetical protein